MRGFVPPMFAVDRCHWISVVQELMRSMNDSEESTEHFNRHFVTASESLQSDNYYRNWFNGTIHRLTAS